MQIIKKIFAFSFLINAFVKIVYNIDIYKKAVKRRRLHKEVGFFLDFYLIF